MYFLNSFQFPPKYAWRRQDPCMSKWVMVFQWFVVPQEGHNQLSAGNAKDPLCSSLPQRPMMLTQYRWTRSTLTGTIILYVSSIFACKTHHLLPQWDAARLEDSGIYICQGENSEGVTEVKVKIIVEAGPGVPVATVSTTEMTVVEGHTVTMSCQATGKIQAHMKFSRRHLSFLTPVVFNPCPCFNSIPQVLLHLKSPGPNSEHLCHGSTQ